MVVSCREELMRFQCRHGFHKRRGSTEHRRVAERALSIIEGDITNVQNDCSFIPAGWSATLLPGGPAGGKMQALARRGETRWVTSEMQLETQIPAGLIKV